MYDHNWMTKNDLKDVEDHYVLERYGTLGEDGPAIAWKEAEKRHAEGPRGNERIVFLSHKHDELPQLQGTVALINSLGASVYIDWMDEDMPLTTSDATARKLKDRIQRCDRFILLATNGSIASKWCNWEVGYGDAMKFDRNNIALLPVAENDGRWRGNEYLGIYLSIERTNAVGPYNYVILDGWRSGRRTGWRTGWRGARTQGGQNTWTGMPLGQWLMR